jgi:uncharacterized membrane protein
MIFMLRYAVTYITTLLAFGVLDGAWITLFVAPLYKRTLGPVMLEQFRTAPAIIFYLLEILGIMVFVVPAVPGAQSVAQNFLFGALFGLFTYSTLDLTSFAILRPWTLYLTVTDIAWGCFVTGAASAAGIAAANAVLRKLL